jgi:hypothetical protein
VLPRLRHWYRHPGTLGKGNKRDSSIYSVYSASIVVTLCLSLFNHHWLRQFTCWYRDLLGPLSAFESGQLLLYKTLKVSLNL